VLYVCFLDLLCFTCGFLGLLCFTCGFLDLLCFTCGFLDLLCFTCGFLDLLCFTCGFLDLFRYRRKTQKCGGMSFKFQQNFAVLNECLEYQAYCFLGSPQDHRFGVLKNDTLKEKALCGEVCISNSINSAYFLFIFLVVLRKILVAISHLSRSILRPFSVFISRTDILVWRWFRDGIFRKCLKSGIAGVVNGKDQLHSERT